MRREVKSCDNCKHWQGFPYVHCGLGCKIRNDIKANVFKTYPVDFNECVKQRITADTLN